MTYNTDSYDADRLLSANEEELADEDLDQGGGVYMELGQDDGQFAEGVIQTGVESVRDAGSEVGEYEGPGASTGGKNSVSNPDLSGSSSSFVQQMERARAGSEDAEQLADIETEDVMEMPSSF